MTAIIESRPRIPRLAMVFIAAVVVLLLTAPKAGAWSQSTDDGLFTVANRSGYSSIPVTVTSYNGSDTNITFPDKITVSGTEYPIVSIGSNVLSKLAEVDGITINVTIPDGYTALDGNAFKNCYGLKSVTIPGSVTKINYNAFEGCKNLASVTFANGSSNLTFGNTVFLNCTSLNSVTLPARLNDLGAGIFQGCTSLSELSIAADNAAYLMQDGNIYAKSDDGESYELHSYSPASSATSFTIPSEVNGKPVTSIFRLAFQNNSTLKSVTVPSSVTNFKASCFEGCSALKKISVAAENVTLSNSCFTGLPEGSVIEVANDTVKDAFEPSKTSYGTTETHYTAGNTTVKVKSSQPEPEATPSAALTVKAAGVKDGYAYYSLTLNSAENVSAMLLNLTFDASQVSNTALESGKKDAYFKLNDARFQLQSKWKEENDQLKAQVMLLPQDGKTAVSSDTADKLMLIALPVRSGVTGKIEMTVTAECANGSTKADVAVTGSPAANRIVSYDVNADNVIDILDITEAQRFYQASKNDEDWATAQKADVNADNKVDIQDLIDIFLQIKF